MKRARAAAVSRIGTAARAWLEPRVTAAWYAPASRPLAPWQRLLWPLALAAHTVARRRRARMLGSRERPPRPVIVVGNLVAGGAGKTPVTAALVQALRARGLHPAIVASGYGGTSRGARLVSAHDDANLAGDEPVLLARETGVPVATARARREAIELLRAAHPDVDVIVSDDGLQHAGLPRTVELAVFDARGAGNGRLLPVGPLREPLEHLRSMDAIVLGPDAAPPLATTLPTFRYAYEPQAFRALRSGAVLEPARFLRQLRGRTVVALAGIAQPQRFFRALAALGVTAHEVPLPDHAPIDRALVQAQSAAFVVMTEKDAVKLGDDADERCYALSMRTTLPPALIDWLLERLRGQPFA